MCEEPQQGASRAELLTPLKKPYQIQTSTFRREELDQMVAGGVNQRCSSQNAPPWAGLTATLSDVLAPALKLLPVQRRNSSKRPRNQQLVHRITESSGPFSWFCCRGLKSRAGRWGGRAPAASVASAPPKKKKKKMKEGR